MHDRMWEQAAADLLRFMAEMPSDIDGTATDPDHGAIVDWSARFMDYALGLQRFVANHPDSSPKHRRWAVEGLMDTQRHLQRLMPTVIEATVDLALNGDEIEIRHRMTNLLIVNNLATEDELRFIPAQDLVTLILKRMSDAEGWDHSPP